MKKKGIIFSSIITVLITGLTVYYLTATDVINSHNLSLIAWYAVIIAIGYFFCGLFILSFVDFLVYRTFTPQMPYLKCVKNTLSGHLGSSVTPYRLGHFPLMAYYQIKDGVSPVNTITGLVKCQIVYSVTSIIVYVAVVIVLGAIGSSVVFSGKTVMLWYVVGLGLIFHIGAFLVTIFLSFNPPLQNWVLKFTANIIGRIKKTFDKQKFIQEKSAKLHVFKEQIQIIGKRFYYYLLPSIIYAAYMLIFSSAPYLCYLLISGSVFNVSDLFTFYVLTLSSAYITNIVPVPGGAGASEVVFKMIFETVIPAATIGSVLVLWRASTFYFAVVIEILWFLLFTLVQAIKAGSAAKKNKIETDTKSNNNP